MFLVTNAAEHAFACVHLFNIHKDLCHERPSTILNPVDMPRMSKQNNFVNVGRVHVINDQDLYTSYICAIIIVILFLFHTFVDSAFKIYFRSKT